MHLNCIFETNETGMSFIRLRIFLLFFLILLSVAGRTQDTLNMLNGKQIIVDTAEVKGTKIHYGKFKPRNKFKDKSGEIDKYRVFSINSGTRELLVYEQDSALGNYRTPLEMRYFVYGEQHAYEYYKPTWALVTGAAVGLGSVLYDTYRPKDPDNPNADYGFFKTEPGILPIITPFAVTLAVGFPRVTLKSSNVSDGALLNDENFQGGYERTAKMRVRFAGLKGSVAGVALGFLGYFILKP